MDGQPRPPEKDRPLQAIRCPRCKGEVHLTVVSSGLFCGLRGAASCKNGCLWDADEQLRMDTAATDFLFR